MEKQSLSGVENGPAKIVVRLSLGSGHGGLLYTSTVKMSLPIFGRSLYAAEYIPLLRGFVLSLSRGMPFVRQCREEPGAGRILHLSNATHSAWGYLTFTPCPLLPRQWSVSTNLAPSKILLTNLDSDLWLRKNW